MANNFIQTLKENWIGAIIGGAIGFMNIGIESAAKLLESIPFGDFLITLNSACDQSALPVGGMCKDVFDATDFKYSAIAIILFIILGAYIQSKLNK